jgi:periplasmic protein TonB
MTRGLPLSLLIHALALGLVLVFGNTVDRKSFEVPRTIGVHLVEMPKIQLPKEQETEPVKIVEPPKPQPKEIEALPPKELPKPKPEIKAEPPKEKVREAKKPPVVPTDDVPPSDSDSEPDEAPVPAMASGAAVAGTDTNFPFAWYLSVMEGQIARNWNPRQLGTGISCVVHFTIQRSGTVSQITLTRSSGVGVYDREALRAVQSTRLPQLPSDFGTNSLGVTMTFNLESGAR